MVKLKATPCPTGMAWRLAAILVLGACLVALLGCADGGFLFVVALVIGVFEGERDVARERWARRRV